MDGGGRECVVRRLLATEKCASYSRKCCNFYCEEVGKRGVKVDRASSKLTPLRGDAQLIATSQCAMRGAWSGPQRRTIHRDAKST